MGVPGLAKSADQLRGKTLDLSFNRIQFTPDLMPADIAGGYHQDDSAGSKQLSSSRARSSPTSCWRTNQPRPAKTQSALLEAIQERRVSSWATFTLLPPFFVLAPEPIEQEGTYPLPEAQLDRFMFLIEVDYPTEEEEMRIARETTGTRSEELKHILSGEEIIFYQDLVRRVPVPEHIYEYAVKLVRATRPTLETSPEWVKQYVAWGAGPRAVQFLILGAKTRAALQGSYIVRREDIDAIVEPVLMHRVVTNFAAESQGITPRKAVARLAAEV
ncbi:MAG: AAA family ATPase [Akkermansia sp.]